MRTGDFDLEGFPHEDHTVRRRIVHEHYAEAPEMGFVNDIALLELTEPVTFKDHIMPICLPRSHANFSNVNATATGWGQPTAETLFGVPPLNRFAAQVVGSESCGAWLETEDEGSGNSPSSLCVHLHTKGSGPCRSGSPMILLKDGRYQVIGLASGDQSIECRKSTRPSFFTNVAAYVDWINAKIKAGSENKVGWTDVVKNHSPGSYICNSC